MELRATFVFGHKDTVSLNVSNMAAAAVIVSGVLPATRPHIPVTYKCGPLPFHPFSQAIFYSIVVSPIMRMMRMTTRLCAHFCFSLIYFYLHLLFTPSSSFTSAASVFTLCVNSWDAFVDGFHGNGPFEQVVIHVHLL